MTQTELYWCCRLKNVIIRNMIEERISKTMMGCGRETELFLNARTLLCLKAYM